MKENFNADANPSGAITCLKSRPDARTVFCSIIGKRLSIAQAHAKLSERCRGCPSVTDCQAYSSSVRLHQGQKPDAVSNMRRGKKPDGRQFRSAHMG